MSGQPDPNAYLTVGQRPFGPPLWATQPPHSIGELGKLWSPDWPDTPYGRQTGLPNPMLNALYQYLNRPPVRDPGNLLALPGPGPGGGPPGGGGWGPRPGGGGKKKVGGDGDKVKGRDGGDRDGGDPLGEPEPPGPSPEGGYHEPEPGEGYDPYGGKDLYGPTGYGEHQGKGIKGYDGADHGDHDHGDFGGPSGPGGDPGAHGGGFSIYRHGDVVTRPTRAIVGEAGPEAVVPLSRGQSPGRAISQLLRNERRTRGFNDPRRGGLPNGRKSR